MAVAANFVTCAIGEETGTSVREPAKNNSSVGLAPTRELVSADGMIQRGITTRVGPICRTVKDTARILTPTRASIRATSSPRSAPGRLPDKPYDVLRDKPRLDGTRIGVVREYMNKSLFTVADEQSIDLVDARDRRPARARRDDRRPGPDRRAVSELRRQVRAEVAEPAVHRPVPGAVPA